MPTNPRSPSNLPVAVLVAEARAMTAETMARAIAEAGGLSLLAHCATAEEVAGVCRAQPPDVAVLDIGLYGNDAARAVASLHGHAPAARILLVVGKLDGEQLARGVLGGADNCISACIDRTGFVEALRATSCGEALVPRALQQSLVQALVRLRGEDRRALSPREIEVLKLAADGLSGPEIATRLTIAPATTKTHLQRAYRKLGVKNRSEAVARGIRLGVLR